MGLGPPVIELYRQLKVAGVLEGVTDVMELGSQDFWCPQQNLVKALCQAFEQPDPPAELLSTSNASQLPARRLYEALGLTYHCVDVDGRVKQYGYGPAGYSTSVLTRAAVSFIRGTRGPIFEEFAPPALTLSALRIRRTR